MSADAAPASTGSPWSVAGRVGARAFVLGLTVVFVMGLVLWARESSLHAERWLFPSSWSEEDLRRVAARAGVAIPVVSAFFMLLEVIVATAGLGVAWILLRGDPAWFQLYVAAALALWSTLGGAMAVVYSTALGDWASVVQGVGWMAVFPIAYLFPDGGFVPRWTRWALAGWLAYLPMLVLVSAVAGQSDAQDLTEVLPVLALFATAAYAGIYRYRKVSTPDQRQQTRGFVTAIVLWTVVVVISVATPLRGLRQDETVAGLAANSAVLLLSYLAAALIPLSIGAAVVRYRLFDIDPWVARSLAYAFLTVILVAAYAGLTTIGALLWPSDDLAGPLLAVVVLAAILHPLRQAAQRRADRFVYGQSLAPKDLVEGLRRSRERILTAREDERRRLQRDLHDGLGPTLASLYQRVDAARSLTATDPAAAGELLSAVGIQTRAVIEDIRGLVHGLRPPELDQLGLAGSIASATARLGSLAIRVKGNLGPLPPVVEIAAYRIAIEAITNAARHAGATGVDVCLARGERAVTITITDDGRWEPGAPGTGIESMRERAEELGGTIIITGGTGRGTLVRATLPVGGLE